MIDGNKPMVRIGGGFIELRDHIEQNQRHFKRAIVSAMNQEYKSYGEVVDDLVNGKKHFKDISD